MLDACLVGTGLGTLLVTRTGERMMGRVLARLPESGVHACLAGAVVGALTATGLWVTSHQDRSLRDWNHFFPFFSPILF